MPYLQYPFELPPLPYDYAALEPYIGAETLHYHHDKHYQTYINNLNAALEPYPALQKLTLTQLLSPKRALPPKAATAIRNNGGGVYNHMLYFNGLAPADSEQRMPSLVTRIERQYKTFDAFKAAFNASASSVFGSGWTALVESGSGTLKIVNFANQNTTLPRQPLLLVDVWEHAYYLDYCNLRAEYLEKIWNVLVV